MRNRIICTLIIGIFSILSCFSQSDQLVTIAQTGSVGFLEWSINNAEDEVVVTSSDFLEEDTISVALLTNSSYILQISVDSVAQSDTVLFSLLINNSPILVVLPNIKKGDHSYTFYTGVKKPQLRIIGGDNAAISDFPWQVCFLPGDYLCGGSILSEKWIITAAHCTFDNNDEDIDVAEMKVVVGTSTPFKIGAGKTYKIKNFYRLEDYDINEELYDLALLEIEGSIDLTNVSSIELISSEDIEKGALDPGVLGWVSGWGVTSIRNSSISTTLQKVQLPVVSSEAASLVWGNIDESFLMAGYRFGNKDACRGDSGGPFIVEVDGEYKLAGVVSWGATDCNSYGAYTRVSTYETWIRRITGVKSKYYLDMPTGDEVVCLGTNTSVYYTDERNGASDYQWKIQPEGAGEISYNTNTAVVEWQDGFVGKADLEVRAVVNSDTTRWITKSIHISDFTSVENQSADSILCAGQDLILSVDVDGYNLSYSWYKDDEEMEADSSTLIVADATADDSGVYSCRIEGACGEDTSDAILATVYPVTAINNQPKDVSLENGDDMILTVEAIGEALQYRWIKDGDIIASEENQDLILNEIDATVIGLYNVEVTGVCGDAQLSDSVFVFVEGKHKGVTESVNIRYVAASDDIRVAVNTTIPYTIELFNELGQQVYVKEDCLYDVSFSIANLLRGVYILEVSNPVLHGSCKIKKHGR